MPRVCAKIASASGSNTAVQTAVTLGGLTSDQTANLAAPLTRGALTKLMVAFSAYRESAKTQGSTGTLFSDVGSGSAYAPYVRIAVQQGWISGYTDGSFRPDQTVTRIQAVAMLYRYARAQGMDTTQGGMAVREFNDYDSISSWAGQSMTWAVNAGILSGRGNNTLAPTAGATRAEMAVMLQQFVGLMEK